METEEISYECSKLKGTAQLTLITKSSYSGDKLIRQMLLKKDCSGRLNCGITPKFSATLWGNTDWESCEYLSQRKNETPEAS